jgi:sugar phosphate isomerase/epimerase
MDALFRLSAFGDEIADDLEEQLRVLRDLRIAYLELRRAWGKNVLHLTDQEAQEARRLCDRYGIAVSAIGSPVGKSPLANPLDEELGNLQRIFQIARMFDVDRVRVFSFYPPESDEPAGSDRYVAEATARLQRMAQLAADAGIVLLLENERGIVGDTIARCRALLSGVDSPHLRFVWDPSNFVSVQEARSVERGWQDLGSYVAHVHVKDGVLEGGGVRVAGEGDGQIDLLLTRLRETGYQGFLALEPHLIVAGHSSGYSGPEGMARAAEALRRVMAQTGCVEA